MSAENKTGTLFQESDSEKDIAFPAFFCYIELLNDKWRGFRNVFISDSG